MFYGAGARVRASVASIEKSKLWPRHQLWERPQPRAPARPTARSPDCTTRRLGRDSMWSRHLWRCMIGGAALYVIVGLYWLLAQHRRRPNGSGPPLRDLRIMGATEGAAPAPAMDVDVPQSENRTFASKDVATPAEQPHIKAAAAAVSMGGRGDAECELIFAMPTVARGRDGVSYLNATLESLLCELSPFASTPRVCVAVYEPRATTAGGGRPTPFEVAEQSMRSRPPDVRRRVFFVRGRTSGGAEGSAGDSSATRAPSAAKGAAAVAAGSRLEKTRRQTADVAHMLLAVRPLTRAHLVLMEDDWVLCEGAMQAIRYLLVKATLYQPGWAALRFSYGLNGILLKADDLPPLAEFLLRPSSEPENDLPDAPVDHLTYRWLRGKYSGGRRYFGTRRRADAIDARTRGTTPLPWLAPLPSSSSQLSQSLSCLPARTPHLC